jgi:hypothetical protein
MELLHLLRRGVCGTSTTTTASMPLSLFPVPRPDDVPPAEKESRKAELEGEGGGWHSGTWKAEEDAQLQDAIRHFFATQNNNPDNPGGQKEGRINWPLVSMFMGGTRSAKQCYGRYSNSGMNMESDAPRILGPWAPEEDHTLLKEVQRQRATVLGGGSCTIAWTLVSEVLGGARTRKQCMVRYNSALQFANSAEKVSGYWHESEDANLSEAVELYRGKGRKGGIGWTLVSEHMGRTRTAKQCKKRWDDVRFRTSRTL